VDLNKKSDAITRSVSTVTTSGGGRGQGHEGRFKGRGKGGRSGGSGGGNGKGGRGRGRGRGRGGRTANTGRWISHTKWIAMPDVEKEAIRMERSNYANKRKLSALTTDDSAQNGPLDYLQTQKKNRCPDETGILSVKLSRASVT
jgi:hypothetical protein